MKTNIYDRIPNIATEDLSLLLRIWNRLLMDRVKMPRHDYHGKCVLRATLILEARGALAAPPPHSNTIRTRKTPRRSHE